MGRQHVHFATGPSFQEVMDTMGEVVGEKHNRRRAKELGMDVSPQGAEDENEQNLVVRSGNAVDRGAKREDVRSGMRSDANILIYLDVRRALMEGFTFWKSENGVVLCDGFKGPPRNADGSVRNDGDGVEEGVESLSVSSPSAEVTEEDKTHAAEEEYGNLKKDAALFSVPATPYAPPKTAKQRVQAAKEPVISSSLFEWVIERGEGLGPIWKDGVEIFDWAGYWDGTKGGLARPGRKGRPALKSMGNDCGAGDGATIKSENRIPGWIEEHGSGVFDDSVGMEAGKGQRGKGKKGEKGREGMGGYGRRDAGKGKGTRRRGEE
jgi:hypothetical protein